MVKILTLLKPGATLKPEVAGFRRFPLRITDALIEAKSSSIRVEDFMFKCFVGISGSKVMHPAYIYYQDDKVHNAIRFHEEDL